MQIAYYIHVIFLILIVVGAGIAFNAVQDQSSKLSLAGNTTSAIVVAASAYLVLIAAGFFNQWFAYYFHQSTPATPPQN